MRAENNRTLLRLIGGQRILPDADPEQQLNFYEALFARLPKEVLPPATLTRYVAYHVSLRNEKTLHFLGVEVDDVRHLPPDMMGWELTESAWRRWRAEAGQPAVVVEQALTWRWSAPDLTSGTSGRLVGEFTASLPATTSTDQTEPHHFKITGHAYVKARRGDAGGTQDNDAVVLVDHDPAWTEQFAAFAAWLRETLGPDLVRRVEHYGSTAIPGIPAKPVIDVLLEVPSFAGAKPALLSHLNNPLWEYWWYSDHMVFIKRDALMGKRTHHVHIAPRGHPVWKGLIFRDYLRAQPQVAARYAGLKRGLAARYREDRERYTNAKSTFVKDVLAEAERHLYSE